MLNLNYFVISAGLGATIGPRLKHSAGPLTYHKLADELSRVLRQRDPHVVDLAESGSTCARFLKRLKRALEASCEGYSPDRVIADPDLNNRFLETCRAFGLDNDPVYLNRSLLAARKAGRLSGLSSKRTIVPEQWRFGPASEIAARAMYYRYGLSVDAILCSPSLASEFDKLAHSLAPGFTSLAYRWAALNVRKRGSSNLNEGLALAPRLRWSPRRTIVQGDDVPGRAGVFELSEDECSLFVSDSEDLSSTFRWQQVLTEVAILEKGLWHPTPDRLCWRYAQLGHEKATVRASVASALVATHQPVFNIPRGGRRSAA